MLQVLIDPSMISGIKSGGPKNPDKITCELSIAIAGCAWENKCPEFTDIIKRDEFVKSLYPWNWKPSKLIKVIWLHMSKDGDSTLYKMIGADNIDIFRTSYPANEIDDSNIIKEYYTSILDTKIKNDKDSLRLINPSEIVYDYSGDSRGTKIEIKEEELITTPQANSTGFLTSSIAQFAQKLAPVNNILELVFFAQKKEFIIPAGTTHFVAFPVGDAEVENWTKYYKVFYTKNGKEWFSETTIPVTPEEIDKIFFTGEKVKIEYTERSHEKPSLRLYCPITPLPEKPKENAPIQLRDENGKFIGETKVEVHDSEELFEREIFKKKLINKTASIFDLPCLFHDYLQGNINQIIKIKEKIWFENVNNLLVILLRDVYSIGNELNKDNTEVILNGITLKDEQEAKDESETKGNNLTRLANGLINKYNSNAKPENDYIKLDKKAVIELISEKDKKLNYADWRGIIEGNLKTIDSILKKPDLKPETINEESVKTWLALWHEILSNKFPDREDKNYERKKIIIQEKKSLFKTQILKIIKEEYFNEITNKKSKEINDRSVNLFSEISDNHFEYYNPSNLFMEGIALNLQYDVKTLHEREFQDLNPYILKDILLEKYLIHYVEERIKTKQLYPTIVDTDLIKDIEKDNLITIAGFEEFIRKYDFNSDGIVNLKIIDEIESLIFKPSNIPPKVLFKVDTLVEEDDLSDEIAGHIILMQRSKEIHKPVFDKEWKYLNVCKINTNDKIKKITKPLSANYLIPSFLPQSDVFKDTFLSLSNERLSFIAVHDIFKDEEEKPKFDSNFTLSYLFKNDNGEISYASALWYGYNYNFTGFVVLNSGIIPSKIRKTTDDWVTPNGENLEIQDKITLYSHLRRVPISKAYTNVYRPKEKNVLPIPKELLPLACELPEWNNNGEEHATPLYLLSDNQNKLQIDIRKPHTSFWNWYAWEALDNQNPLLQNAYTTELKLRYSNKNHEHNEYLSEPAIENTLVVIVEQLFPTKKIILYKTEQFVRIELPQDSEGKETTDYITAIQNGMPGGDASIVKEKNEKDEWKYVINVPEGCIINIRVHCLVKKNEMHPYYKIDELGNIILDELGKPIVLDEARFHSWMLKAINSSFTLTEYPHHYLTPPVEMIFESAMKPLSVKNLTPRNVWDAMEPFETSKQQIALDIKKENQKLAYFSRTVTDHQVWHWNGRLFKDLLDTKDYSTIQEYQNVFKDFPGNINPVDEKTNYAMKWEAWEFSDRPDFSSLEYTTHLRAVRIEEGKKIEQQTIFTDSRPIDEKALYYRFSAEIFGRYELLGGKYIGSVRSFIEIKDTDDNKPVKNQWKRYLKKSTKKKKLSKPVIRFAIPLTMSIDECPNHDEIIPANIMVVLNDPWFAEAGLADKLEFGIELLKDPRIQEVEVKEKVEVEVADEQYYLNAGNDPMLSGKGLSKVNGSDFPNTGNENYYIEHPRPVAVDLENPFNNIHNPCAVFEPAGPVGLTFDFATPTPKLLGSTFILKIKDVNKFLNNGNDLQNWSMIQIAARRNLRKEHWSSSEYEKHLDKIIIEFCRVRDAEIEEKLTGLRNDFFIIKEDESKNFNNALKRLRKEYKHDAPQSAEFEKQLKELKNTYYANSGEEFFRSLKSDWTAKEWVQCIPDTNSLIPSAWKKSVANYGEAKFSVPNDGSILSNDKFVMPLHPEETDNYENRMERYLVITEKVQNMGGQPFEKYKATYKYDKNTNAFIYNDNDTIPKTGEIKGYARLLLVRVMPRQEGNIDDKENIWQKLFGENKDTSLSFTDVQNDSKAANPLVSKRIPIIIN